MNESYSKLFTIIIPVYNGERYITRCLSSIYNQGVNSSLFEVVVVNDGSFDNTVSIIQKLQYNYGNLILINQSNAGVSVARNHGIKASSGKYLIFMDADDELIQSSLHKVASLLSTCECDILITNQIDCVSNILKRRKTPNLICSENYTGIEAFDLGFQRLNAGGAICKNSFIQEHNLSFPIDVPNGEDTIFFSLFQTLSQVIRYENIDFYLINLEENSASRSIDKKLIKGQEKALRYMGELRHFMKDKCDNRILENTQYLLISNFINAVVSSNSLGYSFVNSVIKDSNAMPILFSHFYNKNLKIKAFVLNLSLLLFYIFAVLKYFFKQLREKHNESLCGI